jgi:hypothetical protein
MWASNWAGRGRRLQLEDFERKPPCHHDQSSGRRSRDLAGPMTGRTATLSTGEDCRGPAMTRSGRSLLLAYLTRRMEPPGCRVQGMDERRRLCWSPDLLVPKHVRRGSATGGAIAPWTALFSNKLMWASYAPKFRPGQDRFAVEVRYSRPARLDALIRILNR